jgi:hypothetical protein
MLVMGCGSNGGGSSFEPDGSAGDGGGGGGGPVAAANPQYTDIWATPVVGRMYDSNCDGAINNLDHPVIVFVSGDDFDNAASGSNCQTAMAMSGGSTMCHTGVLRMLDGASGQEIWTLDHIPSSIGFAGMSVAIGDVVTAAA